MPNYHTFRDWPKTTLGVTLKKTFKKPKKPKGGFNDPTDIPDLVLWLDAADNDSLWTVDGGGGSHPIDGQTVGTWEDRSGNANHVEQSGANNRPTYKTGIQNGLAVLRSIDDVLDDWLFRTSSVLTQDSNVTVFYVAAATGDETFGVVFCNSNTSADRIATFVDSRTVERHGFNLFDSAGSNFADNPADIGTAFNQFTSIVDGTDLSARLNGTAGAAGTVAGDGVTANDYTRVFNQQGSITTLFGDIGELVVYGRTLNAGEIKKVEDYLKDKWATP